MRMAWRRSNGQEEQRPKLAEKHQSDEVEAADARTRRGQIFCFEGNLNWLNKNLSRKKRKFFYEQTEYKKVFCRENPSSPTE